MRRIALVVGPPAVFGALLLAAWEAWVRVRDIKDYILPPPSDVARAFLEEPDRYLEALGESLVTALGGLLLASTIAFALAVLMAHSRVLERAIYPPALLVKVTPIVAVYPLLVIWFGFGTWPRVVVAALITFFPMLVNAAVGLRAVDPSALDVLRVLHASRAQVLWKLRVPTSLPYVFAALRISVPLSLIGSVVAEFLSGAGGMGQLILIANGDFATDVLFAAVFVLAAAGIGMTAIVSYVEARVLGWTNAERQQMGA
ncbi:MAG: ABC transporter permease [Dehalococcoidia bacterium]